MTNKICSTCNLEKALSAFGRSNLYKDGYRGQCNPCRHYLNRAYKKRIKDSAPDGFKTCSTCGTIKDFTKFAPHATGADGRRHQCIPCYKEQKRKTDRAYKRPRTPTRYMTERRGHLKRKYGLSINGYEAILAAQNGGCALCGRHPKDKPLNVDHCHTTGRVRGILCTRCNKAIAVLGDNEGGLWKAFNYVAKPFGSIS